MQNNIPMSEFNEELKSRILQQLNLEDVNITDIKDDDPLFGEGLGLDSIDALELIVLLDKYYQIKLTDPAQGKSVFYSVNTMADYIQKMKA